MDRDVTPWEISRYTDMIDEVNASDVSCKEYPPPAEPDIGFPADSKYWLDAKKRKLLLELARIQEYSTDKTWIYDSKPAKELLALGYQFDEKQLCVDFLDFVDSVPGITLIDKVSGEKQFFMAPRRGNKAYAKRLKQKSLDVLAGTKGLRYDFVRDGFRETERYTFALLMTPTVDSSRISNQDGWASVSPEMAQFKVRASRALGTDVPGKRPYRKDGTRAKNGTKRIPASIRSIAVKEGTKRGAPAPHILAIFDRPVRVFRHVSYDKDGNSKVTWRLCDEKLLQQLKGYWPNGFIDIQGVVDGEVFDLEEQKRVDVFPYLFKYITKSVECDSDDSLLVKQFAYAKLLNLRMMHISSNFWDVTNRVYGRRLDTNGSESQQNLRSRLEFAGVSYMSKGEFYASKVKDRGKPSITRSNYNDAWVLGVYGLSGCANFFNIWDVN